jgi:hypothetical protein
MADERSGEIWNSRFMESVLCQDAYMALRDKFKYFLYRYTVQKGLEMVKIKSKQLATVQ